MELDWARNSSRVEAEGCSSSVEVAKDGDIQAFDCYAMNEQGLFLALCLPLGSVLLSLGLLLLLNSFPSHILTLLK
jgi:hypothetical protein